jgi:hypothetical protein
VVILRLSLPSRNAQQGRHGCSFFYVTLTSGELEPEDNTQYGSLVTIDIEQVLLATLWYGTGVALAWRVWSARIFFLDLEGNLQMTHCDASFTYLMMYRNASSYDALDLEAAYSLP